MTDKSARNDRDLPLNLSECVPVQPPASFVGDCAAAGIEFAPGEVETLARYVGMFLGFNEITNLTSVTEPAEVWRRHIYDSLTLMPVVSELMEGSTVIDVGSGGGLPGLPLAIVSPHLRFTLLEATGKKASFLKEAVRILGLTNCEVLQERAERAAHDRGLKSATGRTGARRESYDLVVARAVGRLNTLAELTVPFAKIGGRCALIKGEQAQEEIAESEFAFQQLNAVYVTTLETPTGRIVVLEKNSATPRVYPRADGEPKRAPLGGKSSRLGGTNRIGE
ncbi:MAG: 16S rRNA (guanine(527)-N(7))-methyltransferase RsmG [Phycisphaerales bacterium]|jgi:16S rRNA (guanine527-N7)-methyltransferase